MEVYEEKSSDKISRFVKCKNHTDGQTKRRYQQNRRSGLLKLHTVMIVFFGCSFILTTYRPERSVLARSCYWISHLLHTPMHYLRVSFLFSIKYHLKCSGIFLSKILNEFCLIISMPNERDTRVVTFNQKKPNEWSTIMELLSLANTFPLTQMSDGMRIIRHA